MQTLNPIFDFSKSAVFPKLVHLISEEGERDRESLIKSRFVWKAHKQAYVQSKFAGVELSWDGYSYRVSCKYMCSL